MQVNTRTCGARSSCGATATAIASCPEAWRLLQACARLDSVLVSHGAQLGVPGPSWRPVRPAQVESVAGRELHAASSMHGSVPSWFCVRPARARAIGEGRAGPQQRQDKLPVVPAKKSSLQVRDAPLPSDERQAAARPKRRLAAFGVLTATAAGRIVSPWLCGPPDLPWASRCVCCGSRQARSGPFWGKSWGRSGSAIGPSWGAASRGGQLLHERWSSFVKRSAGRGEAT
jgi:hypothetical protein